MKVLMINGSPRVNGNTSIALKEMEKIFAEEGVESETIQIGNKDIRGCIACGTCAAKGSCVFDDPSTKSRRSFGRRTDWWWQALSTTLLPTER